LTTGTTYFDYDVGTATSWSFRSKAGNGGGLSSLYSNIVSGSTSGSSVITIGGIALPDVGTPIYAATTGSDSNTGTITSPRALTSATLDLAMRSGKGLVIRGGAYTPAASFFDVFSNTSSAANGSSTTSWAVMKAYPGETVTINCGANKFAWDNHHYWCIRDITFNSNGTCWFLGENFGGTNYFWVDNCIFNMAVGGDNNGAVGVPNQNFDYLYFTRNTFNGPGPTSSTTSHNTCAVWCGYVKHLYVIGNRIDNVPKGVYQKYAHNATAQNQVDIQIKNNVISRCSDESMNLEGQWTVVTNNLVYNGGGILVGESAGSQNGDDIEWYHNTIFADVNLLHDSGSSTHFSLRNKFRSNLFTNSGRLMGYQFNTADPLLDTDFNFFTPATNAIIRSQISYSLSTYKAAFPTQEIHGVSGSPTFTGTLDITNLSTFALSSGSLGKNAGHDGADIGVNVLNLLTAN
jgi:hypothetical protein